MVDQELRLRLAASGRYELIDTAPAAAEVARAGYWHSCNGCEAPIAATLGADLALVGWVQKVSNLILNLNLTIRDARRASWSSPAASTSAATPTRAGATASATCSRTACSRSDSQRSTRAVPELSLPGPTRHPAWPDAAAATW